MKHIDSDYDVFAANCPSRSLFDHIFGKWGMLIIARLRGGPARFGELYRAIEGISERMLSKSLKILRQEGVVVREDFEDTPPRVEYSLSESGHRIGRAIEELIYRLYESLEHEATLPEQPPVCGRHDRTDIPSE